MQSTRVRFLVLIVGMIAGYTIVHAGSKQPPDHDAPFTFPELSVLDRFAGPWEVAESHYNKRGEVVASAKGIEEGVWVLDRRTLKRTYTTGEEGNLFRAIGMISWDSVGKKYKGMWFDNASANGPAALSGEWDESAKTMTITLTSSDADGKTLDHKVVDKFLDEERRLVTTYRVNAGQVEKIMEVQFRRARPCPSNLGVIMEGKPSERE